MKEKNAAGRYKKSNFSETVYGARVPAADSRVLDDYARTNRLRRGAMVRQILHKFVLQEQLRDHAKLSAEAQAEPVTRQTLAEQLAPLQAGLAELSATLGGSEFGTEIAASVAANQTSREPQEGSAPGLLPPAGSGLRGAPVQQLLEQVLATVTLVLRLQINYLVTPVLENTIGDDPEAIHEELREAEHGPEAWKLPTKRVVKATEQRVRGELAYEGLIPLDLGKKA